MSNEITPLETGDAVLPVAPAPTAFEDLKRPELIAAAAAFGARETGTAKQIIADIEEMGVSWDDYAKAFGLVEPDPVDPFDEFAPLPNDEIEFIDEEVDTMDELITVAETPQLEASSKYLVKFIGENLYFERGRYKFSQDKPYAIMNARDANDALVEEPEKFRQAFPKELKEYYG